jgi:hypothetical protein
MLGSTPGVAPTASFTPQIRFHLLALLLLLNFQKKLNITVSYEVQQNEVSREMDNPAKIIQIKTRRQFT